MGSRSQSFGFDGGSSRAPGGLPSRLSQLPTSGSNVLIRPSEPTVEQTRTSRNWVVKSPNGFQPPRRYWKSVWLKILVAGTPAFNHASAMSSFMFASVETSSTFAGSISTATSSLLAVAGFTVNVPRK